jgi:hypothetical protein
VAEPEALREHLETSGFIIKSSDDTTEPARASSADMALRIQQDGLPPLGFHLLMADDFKIMAQNHRRKLDEGRIVLAQIIGRM